MREEAERKSDVYMWMNEYTVCINDRILDLNGALILWKNLRFIYN